MSAVGQKNIFGNVTFCEQFIFPEKIILLEKLFSKKEPFLGFLKNTNIPMQFVISTNWNSVIYEKREPNTFPKC